MTDTIKRDNSGRFQPGTASPNPKGRGAAKTFDELLEAGVPRLMTRALQEAEHDNAVLAGLLNCLAAQMNQASSETVAQQLAGIGAAGQPRH